jgi:peroxiredoxin
MLGVGDQAPDFTLSDVQGKQRSLRDLTASKAALIAIYKMSCPVCQFTLPFLERISQSDNIETVAISQDDLEATEEFRAASGITLTTLLDEARTGYPVSNAFGITHVPSMFLVEPGGNISMAVSGFSKRDLEAVGDLAGVQPFRDGEKVPDWKSG